MKLLTWNLAGRAQKAAAQIAFIGSRQADIVALQEFTLGTRALLRLRLAALGLSHQLDTFDLYPAHTTRRGLRKNGLLIASRLPIQNLAENQSHKWPERLLSVAAQTNRGVVEIHNAHVPPVSSNGWVKIDIFQGIFALLATPSSRPRILCGDINSPREERKDGEVVTWGQRITRTGEAVFRTTIRGRDGREWDAAERAVLLGLRSHNISDVFRTLYAYDREGYSWLLTRKGRIIARRGFDHVFASSELRASSFAYLHTPSADGLSNHSSAEVIFDLPG